MTGWMKACRAALSEMRTSWSVTTIGAPSEWVVIAGKWTCPKRPAGPHRSIVKAESVALAGPVFVVRASIETWKELFYNLLIYF